MPNSRKQGTKLAGAYIDDEKDASLARLAKANGFPDKAAFIRALFDKVIEQDPKVKPSAKRK